MNLESDRDRRYTVTSVLQRIDDDTEARLPRLRGGQP
jgi:hypothetical protein